MKITDQKLIEMSKIKTLLMVMGALALVGICFWLTTQDEFVLGSRFRYKNPWLIYGVGWFGIIFFGFCGAFGIRQLFINKPGLILSNLGIMDNLGGAPGRFIPWDDIVGFSVYKVQRQKLLTIMLKEPGKYIEAGNALKRALNRANQKLCGSPVAISANPLKINFDQLLETCNQYFAKYGNHEREIADEPDN